MTGVVFDIKEFTVHDGPGTRVTVFLKGCPLRCRWCHNPEGLSPYPQLMVKESRCIRCGRCRKPCGHRECQPFGRCLHACPQGLVTVSGTQWTSEDLAQRLLRYQGLLPQGGITFSGGEPLMQWEFTADVLARTKGLHRALQTSGYGPEEAFRAVLKETDYVLFDLKLADREQHKTDTGVDNGPILRNYEILLASGKPHVVRIPLIPGITDTRENLSALAGIAGGSRVELMRYNPFAGAKYPLVGMKFPLKEAPENPVDLTLFQNASFV